MPHLLPRPDAIRWSATELDHAPDVIETQLLLSTDLFLALEMAARRHHMTVGQMARVLIARGVREADGCEVVRGGGMTLKSEETPDGVTG